MGRVFAESLVNNIFRDKWELGIRKREVAVEKVMNGIMFSFRSEVSNLEWDICL